MVHTALRALGLALLLAAAGGAAAQDRPARTVTVTGTGEVRVAPDIADLRVGVTARAGTAEAASAQMAERMRQVLSTLAEAGLPEEDVRTSSLALAPVRADNPSGPEAFEARTLVTARVRDLGALGPLLDRVVARGANTLEGVTFGLSEPAEAQAEARRKAMADAIATAETYAAAAGVTLGNVVSIADHSGGGPVGRAFAAEADSMPVAAGRISIDARVEVAIAIMR